MDYYKFWVRVPDGGSALTVARAITGRYRDSFVISTQGLHDRDAENTFAAYLSVYVKASNRQDVETIMADLRTRLSTRVFITDGVSPEYA